MQNLADTSVLFHFENKQSTALNINGTSVYYTNRSFPTTGLTVNTINYYDDYTFDTESLTTTAAVYGITPTTQTKSLPTGSKVRVLETSDWITTITQYDSKGRAIYVASKNTYLNTTDIIKNDLDFTGKVKATTSTHTKDSNAAITTVDTFTYDTQGRLLKQTQTIGAHSETIVVNTYDALGQLLNKKVGNTETTPLQTVDYAYNIRGWLKQINDPASLGTDLFAFKLGYNEGITPLYNGNISLTQWKTANTDNGLKTYNYTYDALNRITSGVDNTNNYSLSFVDYDKNGNILHLKRNGQTNTQATSFGVMDDLTYSYNSGNQLLKVADAAIIDGFGFKDDALNTTADTANDYTYDANGNLKSDANKSISAIQYNYLNLPTQVTINGQNILYVYDALGVKLRKIVNTTTTDYAGNFIYENNVLQFFNQPEGYVEPKGLGWEYVFQYKDHLGNIRLSYADADGNGAIAQTEIREENNYYPFGLKHKGYNANINGTHHKYKYNGKELEEDLGLDTYSYGWRDYDPTIGRFNKIDRFAHKYFDKTPYHYGGNNPMVFIDIAGDSIIKVVINDKTGNINGESTLYIDHTFYEDTKSFLTYAADENIPIHINSSFRTNKKQEELTKKGSSAITPAKKGSSPHNSGQALDFNLFKDDDKSQGMISKNGTVTKDHKLIKKAKALGLRWGGDFSKPDKVHVDDKGADFTTIRDANQKQINGDKNSTVDETLIKRTETLTINKKKDE